MRILGFSFLLLLCLSAQAQAAKFKGYARSSSSGEVLTLTEKIERMEESKDDFLLELSKHAAFYRFPKKGEHSSQIRDFIKRRLKEKKPVVFQIDPLSAQILNMQDP